MTIEKRRAAAIAVLRKFEQDHQLPTADLREKVDSDAIFLIGTAPDGREYSLGYERVPS